MSDTIWDIETFKLAWKEMIADPKFVFLMIFASLGVMSVFSTIDPDVFLLGPIANFFNNWLSVAGPLIRFAISAMLGVFIFVFLYAIGTSQFEVLTVRGFIGMASFFLFVILAIYYMPQLFGSGDPGSIFSIFGVVN